MTALWKHHLEQVGVASGDAVFWHQGGGGWALCPSSSSSSPAATPALSSPYLPTSSFSLGTEAERRPRLNDFLSPSRNVDVYLDGRREPGRLGPVAYLLSDEDEALLRRRPRGVKP